MWFSRMDYHPKFLSIFPPVHYVTCIVSFQRYLMNLISMIVEKFIDLLNICVVYGLIMLQEDVNNLYVLSSNISLML